MNRMRLLALALFVTAFGCNPKPVKLPCDVYVAGSFTAENHYAFSVDGGALPLLDHAGERIELTFFFANPSAQAVELVHVLDSQELERWSLQVPASKDHVPSCVIGPTSEKSDCGASVHVLPHKVGGYYYLRADGDLIEAGMSFILCR